MMHVSQGTSQDLKELDEGVSIFSSRAWVSIYPEGIEVHLLKKGDDFIGHFLCYRGSKLGLGYLICPPFSPHIGLQYTQAAQHPAKRLSELKAVHSSIASWINEQDAGIIQLSLPVGEEESQAYTWKGLDVNPAQTYHIDLRSSEEELWQRMSAERRKNLRKAEQDGLKVEVSEDHDVVRDLILTTLSRQGASLNEVILSNILRSKELSSNKQVLICHRNGVAIACSLIVWDRTSAYYLIGGISDEERHEGASALCLWTGIQEAKRRGNEIFDLEGSMIPSVERFFRGFGGIPKTYFRIQYLSSLGKAASWWKQRGT